MVPANDWQQRTRRLLGDDAVERLGAAHVAVFGVGGVGGHACEALARAGIGHLTIVDGDVVAPSNRNRQVVALRSTLGRAKVDVMAERLRDIAEGIEVHARHARFTPETAEELLCDCDYVVDAIDDVPNKALLIATCVRRGLPLVSSCGAGNRLDPGRFRLSTLAQTRVDPLARAMRQRLTREGIDLSLVRVVWSSETPLPPHDRDDAAPGSIAFVPGAAGLLLAGAVVRDIAGVEPGRDGA